MTLIRPSAVAALVLLAGCGEGVEPILPGFSFTVNPATITVFPGDTVRVRLTDPSGRPLRPTVLGSSTSAATIDTAGLVTAVAPGTGFVSVTAGTGGQAVTTTVPITVLGIALSPSQATIATGATVTLTPQFTGSPAAYGPLTWTSSDTTIATVSADGVVRGVGSGIARIAVSGREGRVRAEATVTVVGFGGWGSLTVRPIDVTLQVGATQQLEATVTLAPGSPAGTSRGVSYVSSDTAVATVSATGSITGRRGGTAVITVAMLASPTVTQAVRVTVVAPGLDRSGLDH
jgi:uncharacterized protein YjdB